MNGSNWTGRTARTLSEAFGPHTDDRIEDRSQWHDEPIALLIAAAVMVLSCWAIAVTLFIWSAP